MPRRLSSGVDNELGNQGLGRLPVESDHPTQLLDASIDGSLLETRLLILRKELLESPEKEKQLVSTWQA